MKILMLDLHPPEEFSQGFGEGSGYELVLASTVEDARFALQREHYDVLVLSPVGLEEEYLEFGRQTSESYPSIWIGLLIDPAAPFEFPQGIDWAKLGLIDKPLTPGKISALFGTPTTAAPVQGDDEDLREAVLAGQMDGKMVGPFQISRKVAEDDWGILYDALQVVVNRPVALKVLHPHFYGDETVVYQFIAFAGAMAHAQNPYITTVYEAGQGNGLIFYARESLPGTTLQEQINKRETLDEEDVLHIVTNIGQALNYEKEEGIRHTPLFAEQILIPEISVPKLLNNVTVEGGETSEGEIDEIQRLGEMILPIAKSVTPETEIMLQKMQQSRLGGFRSWSQVLAEAGRLELARRSKNVVRRPTEQMAIIPEPPKKDKLKLYLTLAAVLLVLIVGGWVAFYFLWERDIQNVMIEIPGGEFVYQSDKKLTLPTFYIDKYEVTIGQYRQFLEAWRKNKSAIKEHPRQKKIKDHTPMDWEPMDRAINERGRYRGIYLHNNMPIFNIDFYDAWAYAQWMGKRLPKEEEWEKAARGPNGNLFPWGNEFDSHKANMGSDYRMEADDPQAGKIDGYVRWSRVGAKSHDQSVYGIMDMAGNVSEWTDSFDIHPDFQTERVPVIRGGSWATQSAFILNRDRVPEMKRDLTIGFRCAADKPPAGK